MGLIAQSFLVPRDVAQDFGFQSSIVGANPAAGATFTRKTPGDFFEILLAVRCQLTTSATVAARLPSLVARDGDGNRLFTIAAFQTLPENLTGAFKWSVSIAAGYAPTNLSQHMPLFPFIFPSGWNLLLEVGSMQVGDQLTQIGIVVQQFNTGIEPERFRGLEPLRAGDLGLVAATPLASPTPTAAPLPGAPAPAPAAAPAPIAAPIAAPAPVPQTSVQPGGLPPGVRVE